MVLRFLLLRLTVRATYINAVKDVVQILLPKAITPDMEKNYSCYSRGVTASKIVLSTV